MVPVLGTDTYMVQDTRTSNFINAGINIIVPYRTALVRIVGLSVNTVEFDGLRKQRANIGKNPSTFIVFRRYDRV